MITYKSLIKRGFKRIELNCHVARDRYGFTDFILVKKISKRLSLEWTWSDPKVVKLQKTDREGNILEKAFITDPAILDVL